jgi:tRNA threonylcarbamoyl adenosine modification protein YeaZ
VLVLVVDTATAAVTAAVARVDPTGSAIVAQRVAIDARGHGELLAPGIAAALAESNPTASTPAAARLGAVVAGLGPGPFTGLRVGLVTAAAMGQALRLPTYGVCSLDGLGAASTAATLVATDARRKEIYWAVYRDGRRITELGVDRPARVADQLAAARVTQALGDGALTYADVLTAALPRLRIAAEPRYPLAAALAAAAAHRVLAGAPTEALTPLYLRRPDAVAPRASQ